MDMNKPPGAASTNAEATGMPMAPLGRTGLSISAIGWGGPAISGDPDDVADIWSLYRQFGGNFIDTAPSYGRSEEVIGEQLAARRSEFVLATKSHPVDADQTLRDIEGSLRRTRSDVIDLFYAPHGCRNEEQLHNSLRKGGVLEGARKAVERGLARHLAFSYDYFADIPPRRLLELIETGAYDAIQIPYGLVPVEPVEAEVIPAARARGMAVIANFPTLNGLTAREWGVFHADFEGLVDTPAQATLLAVLCHPGIDCVLSRFRNAGRTAENCGAIDCLGRMTPEQQMALRQRVERHGPVRFLERDDCPESGPGVGLRYGLIQLDLFTRFGFAGAKPQIERFLDKVDEHPDVEWSEAARAAIEQARRALPSSP